MKILAAFIIGATLAVACTKLFDGWHRLPRGFQEIKSQGFTFAWRETIDCWTNNAGDSYKFSKGGPQIVKIKKSEQ